MKEQVRLRFSMHDDLMLLQNVCNLNPYEDGERWKIIQRNLHILTRKSFSMRCVKDHLEHLLKLYSKSDFNNLRKSGTLQQAQDKELLLAEIQKLSREFKHKPKSKESTGNHFKDEEFDNPDASSNNSLTEFEIDPLITCKLEPHTNVIEINSAELTPSDIGSSSNVLLVPIRSARNNIDDIPLPPLHPITRSLQEITSISSIANPQENSEPVKNLNGHSTESPRRYRMIRKKAHQLRQNRLYKQKLSERELDLQERKMTLEERKLKLEEEKFQLDKLERETKLQLEKQEREKRLELENQERQNKMQLEFKEKENKIEISKQQQKIIDYLIDFKSNNL